MTEDDYILAQRLTLLRAARVLLLDAFVHLEAERALATDYIRRFLDEQIAVDELALRVAMPCPEREDRGHDDPDNSGLCIYCGLELRP